jgi:hypothetical protein
VAWGVWMAIGASALARRLVRRIGVERWSWGYGVLALALVPLLLNYRAATRRGSGDETFARDFARALLQSVPPGGILFTNGDNDSFPLWHAQAVDGVRRDVTVVCLALAETPWYMRQLRRASPDTVDRSALAAVWAGEVSPKVTWPLLVMDDAAIQGFTPFLTNDAVVVQLPNGLQARVAKGAAIYGKDAVVLEILRQNAGRRPIAWSVTASERLFGLGPHLVMQGLALVLPVNPVDTAQLSRGLAPDSLGPRVDAETTRRLAAESWQYGRLLDGGLEDLEPSSRSMAAVVALPLMQAGAAYYLRGDTTHAAELLSRATRLTSDSTPRLLLQMMRAEHR